MALTDRPTPDELDDMGLVWEDVAADYEIEVFEDNYMAVVVFINLSTQWRAGPGGIYGLDYNVYPFVFQMLHIDKAEYEDLFQDLRILEAAGLEYIKEIRDKKAGV